MSPANCQEKVKEADLCVCVWLGGGGGGIQAAPV